MEKTMKPEDKVNIIRQILLKDWDPLSVGENPHLSDEYDDYIQGVLRLLDSHCNAEQLERYFVDIERRWKLSPAAGASVAAKNILRAVQNGV
jgi:hypothetical protein